MWKRCTAIIALQHFKVRNWSYYSVFYIAFDFRGEPTPFSRLLHPCRLPLFLILQLWLALSIPLSFSLHCSFVAGFICPFSSCISISVFRRCPLRMSFSLSNYISLSLCSSVSLNVFPYLLFWYLILSMYLVLCLSLSIPL